LPVLLQYVCHGEASHSFSMLTSREPILALQAHRSNPMVWRVAAATP